MKNRPHVIPAIIATVMLLVAVAPLPYGYYQFLRWVICAISAFIAVEAYSWGKKWATWLFVPIAVLFNPLIPIHLTKEIWQPIDLTCALLFSLSLLFLAKPMENKS